MTPWVNFDGKNCGGCKHLNERGYCEFTACIIPCTFKTPIPEIKPQTNADRIRAMTDEELAKWLASFVHCDCPAVHHRGCGSEECDVPWLDWLKQGAT